MKTLELDLEKDQRLDNLGGMLKSSKIKLGQQPFQLKIAWHYDINDTLYAGFLLLLATYLREIRNKIAHDQKPDLIAYDEKNSSYYLFYIKNHNVDKLESKIEKDFKIDIEIEKKNPLDEVFGLLKGEPVNLKKLRSKAWQRVK